MNKKYYCSLCDIGFDGKTHYDRHCETDKHKNKYKSPENNSTLQYMNEHENLKERIIELEKMKIELEKINIGLKSELDAYKECHKLLYRLGITKEHNESSNNYHKCIEPIIEMIKETNIDKVFEKNKDITDSGFLDDSDFPFSELYWSLLMAGPFIEKRYLQFIKQYITLDDFRVAGKNHPHRFYFFKDDDDCYTEVESNNLFEQLIASINSCLIDYGKHIHKELLIDKCNDENKNYFKLGTLAGKYVNYESMRDKLIKEKHQQ